MSWPFNYEVNGLMLAGWIESNDRVVGLVAIYGTIGVRVVADLLARVAVFAECRRSDLGGCEARPGCDVEIRRRRNRRQLGRASENPTATLGAGEEVGSD
ncbi:RNA-binding protein Hfq [Striga asiatica]|uniref:RNA-binding protein Hfq n=1 Tax=Striga asiatica TaxID=4170 RepID=A0A5A7P4M4_STRAF|nr:RNA-binding protein Hfq [Striga asiatica]